jgi:hypothetical protein
MLKLLLLALALIITAVDVDLVAGQQFPSNVSLSGQVDWFANTRLNAYVRVSCEGGVGTVTVQVQQANPPLLPSTASGSQAVICDGTQEEYGVDLLGGPNFQLGEAEGVATLTAPSGIDVDTRHMRITKP